MIWFSVAAGNQDVAIDQQQFGGIVLLGPREALNGAIALAEFPQRRKVDAVFLVQAAVNLDDADDLVSGLRHEAGRVRTDVAEALHDDAGGIAMDAQFRIAFSQTMRTPRPVASRRPREPPMLIGLPVTTAVTVWRMCME